MDKKVVKTGEISLITSSKFTGTQKKNIEIPKNSKTPQVQGNHQQNQDSEIETKEKKTRGKGLTKQMIKDIFTCFQKSGEEKGYTIRALNEWRNMGYKDNFTAKTLAARYRYYSKNQAILKDFLTVNISPKQGKIIKERKKKILKRINYNFVWIKRANDIFEDNLVRDLVDHARSMGYNDCTVYLLLLLEDLARDAEPPIRQGVAEQIPALCKFIQTKPIILGALGSMYHISANHIKDDFLNWKPLIMKMQTAAIFGSRKIIKETLKIVDENPNEGEVSTQTNV